MATTTFDVQLLQDDEAYFKSSFRAVHGVDCQPTYKVDTGRKTFKLSSLFKEVVSLGGFVTVSLDKESWTAVGDALKISTPALNSFALRELYRKWLLDLELQATGAARPPLPPHISPSPSLSSLLAPSLLPPPAPPAPPVAPAPVFSLPFHPPQLDLSSPSVIYPPPPSPTSSSAPSLTMATPAAEAAVPETRGESPSPTPTPSAPTVILDHTGGDIFHRSYMGIMSKIPAEVEAGLHHWVMASDKYQEELFFHDFESLMESLIEQVLKVGELAYGISWEPNYNFAYFNEEYKENSRFDDLCSEGTFDLLDRLNRLEITFSEADVRDDETVTKLRLITEAALVLRNMCQVAENAAFMDVVALARDCATIVLKLPDFGEFTELKNHILEVVVEACPWWDLWERDHLFITLMEYLNSNDRFHILCALRALTMFSYELEGVKKFGLSKSTLTKLTNLLLLENDPELVSAVLDFLYQYVCEPENVEMLLSIVDLPTTTIPRLVSLLMFDAEHQQEIRVYDGTRIRDGEQGPRVDSRISMPPQRCVDELMGYEEPERTSRWAQCVFLADDSAEVSQRAAWIAYQQTFVNAIQPNRHQALLDAANFIQAVTHTFEKVRAQVVVEGSTHKFVITGIRPRAICRDMGGWPYIYCKWRVPKNPAPAQQAITSTSTTDPATTTTATPAQTGAGPSTSNYQAPSVEDAPEGNEQGPALPQSNDPALDRRLADETPANPAPQFLELSDCSFTNHSLNHPEWEYCNRVWTDPEKYRKHIMAVHMGLRIGSDGNWHPFDRFKKEPITVCQYDNCEEVTTPTNDFNYIAAHVSGHAPPIRNPNDYPLDYERAFFYPKRFLAFNFFVTPQDGETKEPFGIAYKALLIMRNILLNVPSRRPTGRYEGEESWGVALYYSQRRKLLELADQNPVLRKELFDFVTDIDNSRWGFIFEY